MRTVLKMFESELSIMLMLGGISLISIAFIVNAIVGFYGVQSLWYVLGYMIMQWSIVGLHAKATLSKPRGATKVEIH